jgi:glycosyltransferase involved in cell wall biosynthesis
MSKSTFVVSCPIDTYSGYGSRSRDVVKALIELDKYDVKIMPQRWGNTPMGFIQDNPEWAFLIPHILPTPQLTAQPDIWCQITVPNEFQQVGKYNIGITAGIESTIAPADWVEGCQRMNLVLGSSKHSIEVLKKSKFEKRDQNTQQVVGYIEWTGDSEILFEGANTETYKPDNKPCMVDFNVKEDFAYLFVGHWIGNTPIGEDRKNISLLIKGFYETFKNKTKKPALILKTSQVSSSYMDRDRIIKMIQAIKSTVNSTNLPNIYLLHGEFTDEEMNSIYNHSKVKAMVSLTKGEGFGRPLLEFSLTNKPIITTNWSGHTDYLNPEFTTLLPGTMTKIHPAAANNMLLAEAEWFSVDYGHVGHHLKDMFENYKNYVDKGKRQGYYSRTNFSFDKMREKLDEVLTAKLPEFPKQVQLQLPKLKKIELPKLKKIEA